MARELLNQNHEGFQVESRGALASPQLQLDARDSSWVAAQRSAAKLPAEFDNGLQLVAETVRSNDKPDYLHSIDKAGVKNALQAAELTAGFATSFVSGVYNNMRFLADEGFIKLGQGVYGAGAVAVDYYTHTDLSTIGGHAREATSWIENQSSQWLYNYSRMDAWHRGEEIGKISSLFLPYGASARGKVLADLEASVARNGAMLGVEGATQLDCASAAKASWLGDLWKKIGKGEKSAENATEQTSTGCTQLTVQEILVRELIAKPRAGVCEQLIANVQEGLRSLPQRDLQDVLSTKYKVELAETLAAYDSKLAKQPIREGSDVLRENVRGLTIPERLRIFVPERRVNLKGELVDNVANGASVARHEVGHVLCEQRGWMQDLYAREAFMREANELIQKANANPASAYEQLANTLLRDTNAREEVYCNLYAELYGGCGLEPELASLMQETFRDTVKQLARLNERPK